MTQLMHGWTAEHRRAYGREVVRFNHRLADSGLFTNDALARLLDEHPRDRLEVLTMERNPPPDQPWIVGDAAGLEGAEILAAIRWGAVWVDAREAMNGHPRYRELFHRLKREFSQAIGRPIFRAGAGITVSGPRMGIFFHVDPFEGMIWHVRGTKTLHVYPATDDSLPEATLEALLLRESSAGAPFRPEMEHLATPHAMAPGEAAALPLHSPHRVVNGPELCVSVACEYHTVRSSMANGVYYVNGRVRRATGLQPRSRATPAALAPAYWAAAKALHLIAPLRHGASAPPVQFDLDLTAPDGIRWREGFGPQAKPAG